MPLELLIKNNAIGNDIKALTEGCRGAAQDVSETVADIIADVRARGDEALIEYTGRFDRIEVSASGLRFSEEEIDTYAGQCAPELLEAIDFAATRIEAFHARQSIEQTDFTDDAGVRMAARWTPVSAAGLYVPGGLASYPSSVLMNAIPANVAGVPRRVMVVPTPDGKVNPAILAAARRAGITEIYRVGGAQAIAALAYGTETIAPVDKITGPGNAYVAEAKRQVFGQVGIDMVAGPSEILVVSDNNNDPAWIAADLLSQAEHDEAAQSILVTDDADFAGNVKQAVETQLETMPRAEIARKSWENHGVIIVLDGLMAAAPIIDLFAPEHLELALDQEKAQSLANKVKNAGAIFLGRLTPEAIGDYVGGPNHVLPTSGCARFSSGLNVLDFMKRTTLLQCNEGSFSALGRHAEILARAEGLDGHALSVALRLNS